VIVDSSAIIAILQDEPEADLFYEALNEADVCRMSVGTYVELFVVVDDQRSPLLSRRAEDLLALFRVQIEPVTATQARLAREAFKDFGKGIHKAGLNYGDLFAYALARERDEPLLFKGNDFPHTDIIPAVAP
jgi:ribonuclease VapC